MMTFGGNVAEPGKNLLYLPFGYERSIIEGHFDVCNNRLESMLKFPKQIDGFLNISNNKISSFQGCPIGVTTLYASYNRIQTLINVHKHIPSCSILVLDGNPISEGGIGLLLIKGILSFKYIHCDQFQKAGDIISKYIKYGRAGLLECQEELINAKLEKFSRL